MAGEIESEFVPEWGNELSQCQHCTSFLLGDDEYFCEELKSSVPSNGHCNFFSSRD